MPAPPTLKIAEIFASLQGEGLRQGEPTIFIRLAGCNLRCSFCDTKKAWRAGREMTLKEILARVETENRHFPASWVCLTGGEPLLQPLKGLIRVLKRSGFLIQIETNGTLKPSVRADWWTVSPKPPEYLLQPEFKFRARELKLVVTRDLKIKTIEHLRSFLPARTPIILQPQSGRRWSQEKALALIKQCSQHNMENIRLMIQLHRWLKIP